MDELGRFSRLVLMIQEAALAPERWNTAVSAIVEAAGGSDGILFSPSLPPSLGGFWASRSIQPDHMESYARYYFEKDVWRLGQLEWQYRPGHVFPDESFIRPEVVSRSEFYNDFLKTLDVGRLLCGIVLPNDSSLMSGGLHLSIFKPMTKNGFDSRGQKLVQRLVPHLQAAIKTRLLLRAHERAHALRESALNALDAAVLVVDREARIVFANAAAARLLSAADGLSVTRGVVTGATAGESGKIRAFIGNLVEPVEGVPAIHALRVARPSGAPSYACMGQRLPLEAEIEGVRSDALVIVFIRELAAHPALDAEALKRLHDLTEAEARLACLLAQGLTLEQAASIRGIGYETARTYLKALFGKTGCHRQAELVSLLVREGRI